MSDLIEPRLLRGFRDYLPQKMIARQEMIDSVRSVYESFGFLPLETPAIEDEEVLTGQYGAAGSKEIYNFKDAWGNRVALRYDLTVPLARVVAMYPDLTQPFKRYQCSAVWRADKPKPGRYREFIQFDADIVGSASPAADAEIITVMNTILEVLKISGFKIKINNRKILNAALQVAGVPAEKWNAVLRAMDKIDRVGWEGVREELARDVIQPEESGESELLPGIALDSEVVDKIGAFISISGKPEEVLAGAEHYVGSIPEGLAGIAELRAINRILKASGLSIERNVIDLSIVRGLAYYTGPVFEAYIDDLPQFGSIYAGGRYDNLVGRFMDTPIPATGASVGVDRLFSALEELDLIDEQRASADVFIPLFDKTRIEDYFRIAVELRRAGLRTEVYLDTAGLKKQLKYADRRNIPVAVIVGDREFSTQTVAIKDLRSDLEIERKTDNDRQNALKQATRKKQTTVPRDRMILFIKQLLQT